MELMSPPTFPTLVAILGPDALPPNPSSHLGCRKACNPPQPPPQGSHLVLPPQLTGGPRGAQAEGVPQASRRPHHLLHGRHLGLHLGAAPLRLERAEERDKMAGREVKGVPTPLLSSLGPP